MNYSYMPYLAHAKKGSQVKGHKYISRSWKNGRWSYVYKEASDKINKAASALKTAFSSDNPYMVDSSNYESKMNELAKSEEWNSVKNTSEYANSEFGLDNYLLNKKHPVLDALTDYGYGRKTTVNKMDLNTFAAGAKDYVEMGRRTIENIMTLSVGILTTKIKNQQGTYDKKKDEIRENVKTGSALVNDMLTSYSSISNGKMPSNSTVNSTVNNAISTVAKEANNFAAQNPALVKDVQSLIDAYAKKNKR